MSASAPHLVPSILAADFAHLGDQIAAVEPLADRFQVDVMDGHFVPNISMGPMFVETVRKLTRKTVEAHLMVSRPEDWIVPCAHAGADVIIVHAEATVHLNRVLTEIAAQGARPAVAINPATPLGALEEVLTMVEMVLVMTINPGFGGQRFLPATLDKIRRLRTRLDAFHPACDIEIDGGVDVQTIGTAAQAGANLFVAGTSIFDAPQGPAAGAQQLRDALQAALNAPRPA